MIAKVKIDIPIALHEAAMRSARAVDISDYVNALIIANLKRDGEFDEEDDCKLTEDQMSVIAHLVEAWRSEKSLSARRAVAAVMAMAFWEDGE